MQTNNKYYSDRSNESNLREGSYDWSALTCAVIDSVQWDTRKHSLAERNLRNETTTNHERSANSALRTFRIMGPLPYGT